jgi:hypothetical protein
LSVVPSGQEFRARAERPAFVRDRLQLFRLAAAIIWTVLILVLCWLPPKFVQKIEGESPWFRLPDLDKAIHGLLFLVLAILWRRAYPSRRAIGAVILGGIALGALSELGQLLPIVRRHAELYDLAMDSVGVLFGVAIAPLFEPLFRAVERLIIRLPSPAGPAVVER